MSLTVRCPNCDARFRAEAGQLRVAHGWVRCGRCQQGFDAASQSSLVSADAPAARSPMLQRAAIDTAGDATAAAAAFRAPDSLVQRAAQDRRKPLRRLPAPPAALPPTTPAFMREEAATLPASSSWHGFSWLVGAVLLVVLLLAQVLLQHRDRLAARAPAAAPLLGQACALLGCVIAPPREIDALVISNSSLTKIGADGYRLSLAVKNQSNVRLLMPSIELSLLDAAERTVLRRVLLARDVDAVDQLEPYGEWVGAISFDLPERSDRIAGYRVLAFYP